MINLNDFRKYYRTISNTELLSILDNPSDYQPQAVEAAQKEFSYRQLSEIEIREAQEQLNTQQIQGEKQKGKVGIN